MVNNNQIINFYKNSEVSKYLPNIKDEQVAYTGMKLFKHILVCGGTGSGKSNMFMNYLYQTSQPKDGTFAHIFICRITNEPFYAFIQQKLKDQVTFFNSVSEFPDVDTFTDQVEDTPKQAKKGEKKEKKSPPKLYLIVFDDTINDRSKKDMEKVDKYFTYGRKKNLTIMFLSQSFFDTSTFIRKQVSYVILCGIRGTRDLSLICKDYASIGVDKNQLVALYENAMEKENDDDLPFFKLTCIVCPINEKFSKGFLGYYQLN